MTKSGRSYGMINCSFCGKSAEQVEKIITGPQVHICNECVNMCTEILHEEKRREAEIIQGPKAAIPTPKQIKEHLDNYVIGQDYAKMSLSVAVYNHYKRLLNRDTKDSTIDIEKSNILFCGNTGTGKTLLAQTMARFLNVPFTIADATVLTEAGYVGEDVDNIIVRLLQAAEYDVEKCERGIIYVDEIDKIARASANPSVTRDVSGEGVQQGLLKLLEGSVCSIPPKGGRKHPEQALVQVNTRNILFICGGAFEGLEDIVKRRVGVHKMGFISSAREKEIDDASSILRYVEPDDLIQFGIIPELTGRLPVIAPLEPLDEKSMYRILTEPKNALIKQFTRLLEMDGVKLKFTEEALRAIVQKAMMRKTGARGLRSIMESVLLSVMYDTPSRYDVAECVITKDVVMNSAEPDFVYKSTQKIA